MGRQTHNKSELHCNLKLCVLAKQEPNFKFAAAKSSKKLAFQKRESKYLKRNGG